MSVFIVIILRSISFDFNYCFSAITVLKSHGQALRVKASIYALYILAFTEAIAREHGATGLID